MARIKVWDPFIRLFHWSLVILFAANSLVVDDDSKLHIWVGYAILGLVGLRSIWGFIGPRHARFADFPRPSRAPWHSFRKWPLGASTPMPGIARLAR